MSMLVGRKVEILYEDETSEKFKVERVFQSNGDIKINRKGQNRIELVSSYNEFYLRNKMTLADKTMGYKWCDAYLKNSKTHQPIKVRGCDEIADNTF